MKISGNNHNPVAKEAETGKTVTDNKKNTVAPKTEAQTEAVKMAEGAIAGKIRQALASAPEVNQTRVEELKKMVRSGTFKIDADKIADGIMKDFSADPPHLAELADNLEHQYQLHQQLLEFLQSEQELGLSFSRQALETVEHIQTNKYRLLGELNDLDTRRASLVKDITVAENIPADASLRDISAKLSSVERGRLLSLRERLLQVTNEIRSLSAKTSEKAKARLRAFNNLHEMLLHNGSSQSQTYAQSGRLNKNSTPRIISHSI
ncbi:hypothetical protein CHS0354_026831 [Potamilus streckersoni]|uniref:Negative regulator of flagellin synthesis n=1 Tax=Potamilus streckersoni TaxID=2493646 RepID=A0AAE0T681_9BIVA|nr:hypothetical protein CHS0354_026831 [Potamilus streckersoni]